MRYDNEHAARGKCAGKRWQQTMNWIHEAR